MTASAPNEPSASCIPPRPAPHDPPPPELPDRPLVRRAIHVTIWLLASLVVGLIAAGALAVAGVRFGRAAEIALPIGALAIVANACAALCLGSILRNQFVFFMWVGLGFTVAAIIITAAGMVALFNDWINGEFHESIYVFLAITSAIPALIAAHIALVTRKPLKTMRLKILRGIVLFIFWTMCLAAFVAAAAFLASNIRYEYFPPQGNRYLYNDPLEVLAGVAGGVVGMSMLASLGMNALFLALLSTEGRKRKREQSTLLADASLRLTCPECGTEQAMQPGYRLCAKCRHRLYIALEEPRCSCGYVLYRLQSDRCPECGRPAPPHVRPANLVGEDRFRRPVGEDGLPIGSIEPTLFAPRLRRDDRHAAPEPASPPVERAEVAPSAPPTAPAAPSPGAARERTRDPNEPEPPPVIPD